MHRTMPDLPPQIGVLVELDKENAEVAKGIAQHRVGTPALPDPDRAGSTTVPSGP